MSFPLNKNSYLKELSVEDLDALVNYRITGATHKKCIAWIKERYPNLKAYPREVNLSRFFKTKGASTRIARAEKRRNQKLDDILGTNSIEDLIVTLNDWLKYYTDQGQKLTLKETIMALTKLHELNLKRIEMFSKDGQSEEVKTFIQKIQQDFASPKIQQEAKVEFNKDGQITSKTITVKQFGNAEKVEEEPETEEEEVAEAEKTGEK